MKSKKILWLCLLFLISANCFAADFEVNSAGVLTKYTGSGGNVIIPETVDGITVTSIGYTAFYDCSSLTSVIIPNSAVRIGFCAFGNCSNLLSVAIPNSITTIEDFAFLDCSELISVTIPDKVITIGTGIFAKCTNLQEIVANSQNDFYLSIEGVLYNKDTTSIVCYPGGKQGEFTIPNSVTTIGKGAFAGCTNLTSVIIPNTVTSIDQNAFAYSGLTSITIPDLVTTIGSSAFAGCSYLLSVAIPESVTVINVETFKDCNNLSSVFIPHSVTQIHEWAFDGCNTLSSITLPSSIKYIGEYNVFPENLKTLTVEWSYPPNIHLGMLGSTKSACVLRVPTGSKQVYQESSFWKDFKNIEEYDFSSVYTGNLTSMNNLCMTIPCLPGGVLGVEIDSKEYVLSYNSHWFSDKAVIDNIEYFVSDKVEIEGTLAEKQDINLIPYLEIEIETIKKIATDVFEVNANASVMVYPNPANDILFISPTVGNQYNTIEIYDMEGKQFLSVSYSSQLEISGLRPGIYLLNLVDASKKLHPFKFIKR